MNSQLKSLFMDEDVSSEDMPEELFLAHTKIYNRWIKRALGLITAGIFMVFLLPLHFVISFFIVAETGFPIFYRGDRGGYKGKKFKIYKYRSMIQNADQIGGGTTAYNDERITKVGHLLRNTKLDEIPQLLNIVKGEMAFVGPRPELLKYTDCYQGSEKLILSVRPGITDYSSLEFISLDEIVGERDADIVYEKRILKRKNKLRLKYVADISFYTDLKLFIITVIFVIRKAFRFVKNGQRE